MKFFKRRYLGPWQSEDQWSEALRGYREHIDRNFDSLPESAKAFHRQRISLHDAVVMQFFRPAPGMLDVELSWYRLEFLGVRRSECPVDADEPVWLYDEIDVAPKGGFILRALFDQGEFEVEASEVRVFNKGLKRYVIPEEAPPPAPTLFLGCGRPAKRKKR